MIIVITAEDFKFSSKLDLRFGRAKFFIAYNSETGDWRAVDNKQNLNAAQGAGIQAAQMVIDLNAEVVITGNCGPKAFKALQAANIKVYSASGTDVQDAIMKYNRGELVALSTPNSQAHSGSF